MHQDQALILKWQETIKNELRQVIAEGEEVNLFQDPKEGMWFGSVNKNKNSRLFSQHPTRVGVQYAQQINRLLASPPKKRSQPSRPSDSKGPPSSTTNGSSKQTSTVMHVKEAFRKQNNINKMFHLRIGQLEVTTNGIDNKVDLILDSLETLAPRKSQCTTENMEYESNGIPDRSAKTTSQGRSKQWCPHTIITPSSNPSEEETQLTQPYQYT